MLLILWHSSVVSGKLGALRLKVRLVEDRILPSVYYQPLIHLLVESVISPTEVSCTISPQPEPHPYLSWFIKFLMGIYQRVSGACHDLFSPDGGEQCSDHAGGGDYS